MWLLSRMAAGLDAQVDAFRTRSVDAEYPYVWLDARYEKVREDGRVQSMGSWAPTGCGPMACGKSWGWM